MTKSLAVGRESTSRSVGHSSVRIETDRPESGQTVSMLYNSRTDDGSVRVLNDFRSLVPVLKHKTPAS